MSIRSWAGRKLRELAAPDAPAPRRKPGVLAAPPKRRDAMADAITATGALTPRATVGLDSCLKQQGVGLGAFRGPGNVSSNEAVMGFFAGHALPMPYSICAHLAAHWLVDKACRIPARDAVRQGWMLDTEDDELRKQIERADRRMRVAWNLQQFVHLGRVFGTRILMFDVDSPEVDYYSHPFNPDGVRPGSYRGIIQVDPQWCVPELENGNLDPGAPGFYEPDFWMVGRRRVHKSHLIIFRNGQLPDLLKPAYRYGGVSVPQRIVERVYSAERTANEASELAMAKRVSVLHTDLAEVEMNPGKVEGNLRWWRSFLDNWGVKLLDSEDKYEQHDTSLADFDAVVMIGYQLVAAAANLPATKLLGTTPKGFNATGEYEEGVYHEELESIQSHDLSPVLDRHYLLLARSNGRPELDIDYTWSPLDTPTALEYAQIELAQAQRDAALVQTGAIDGADIRDRLRKDRDSAFYGVESGTLDDPIDDPLTSPSGINGGEGDEQQPVGAPVA